MLQFSPRILPTISHPQSILTNTLKSVRWRVDWLVALWPHWKFKSSTGTTSTLSKGSTGTVASSLNTPQHSLLTAIIGNVVQESERHYLQVQEQLLPINHQVLESSHTILPQDQATTLLYYGCSKYHNLE